MVGARELLGTFQTLESAEELLFSFCRKLTPASLLQSPIVVGTLGDRTLVWPAALGMDGQPRAAVPTPTGEDARPSTCLGCFGFATALPEALDQQVKDGDKEQVEDRAHDHAPEDSGAYGVASVLSRATGRNQWDNAHDEG